MYKISKLAFASKTALATILLGFLFVGGASLRAQEGSENGWFVSASPLIFGASKIETKTTITAGGGEVVGDLTADIRTSVSDAYDNAVQNLARDLCAGTLAQSVTDNIEIIYLAEGESDATDFTQLSGGVFGAVRFRLNGVDQPFAGSPEDIKNSNTNVGPIADSACKDAFDGLLLQDLSANASSSETSVGKALAGNGFQVGYRDGDYRYSLTNYSWAAETDKLDLQLAMIEYYLAKGLLLGLGTANVKLDSSIEEAAINQTDTRVMGFITKNSIVSTTIYAFIVYLDELGVTLVDRRVNVTREQTRSAFQSTTTKTVEVKNPSALTIKFTYKFW